MLIEPLLVMFWNAALSLTLTFAPLLLSSAAVSVREAPDVPGLMLSVPMLISVPLPPLMLHETVPFDEPAIVIVPLLVTFDELTMLCDRPLGCISTVMPLGTLPASVVLPPVKSKV